MCIRDRQGISNADAEAALDRVEAFAAIGDFVDQPVKTYSCLLYTSDAADERSSVDLGGRRIIKKKKSDHHPSPSIRLSD